jgi:VWFA-related protein
MGVFELKKGVLAGLLAMVMVGVQARPQLAPEPAKQETVAQQQAIPDAPKPQAPLPNLNSVAPGEGTTSSSSDTQPAQAPAAPTAPGPSPAASQKPTYEAPVGKGEDAITTLLVTVDAVDVAFTVKDSKGRLVPGLTSRDVQVYENGLLQHIQVFTNESLPMSVAIVIDQSMTQDEVTRVNNAMGALQDAFTPYDEVAVFTYNKGPKLVTDFTGAQSARLTQAIERSKGSGRDVLMAGSLSGPMAQTTVINDQNVDPNTSANRGHSSMTINPPVEVHPLNDAILAAATALSTRPIGRRRVIYVISDGKEYGSETKTKELIKYLQRNRIEVDGTLTGDSALWGLGTLDRIHLPLMMRDNVLKGISDQTGGNIDSDFRTPEIEKSFNKIALEARSRYTVGYTTHEPFLDGKYRRLEIKVLKPNLTVLAPPGYWPWATQMNQRPAVSATP